jgi:hypothetical protein
MTNFAYLLTSLPRSHRSGNPHTLRTSIACGFALACCFGVAPTCCAADPVRVATFNLALYGNASGQVLERLNRGDDPQARALAEIIQRAHPQILVLNEIDYDTDGAILNSFCDKYLAVPQNVSQSPKAAEPLLFPHRMAFASNTGEHSGVDLDKNGDVDATLGSRNYAGDCYGYGIYPGQYAFAVLSQFPIDKAAVREFRKFLWKDMPGAQLPDDAATPEPGDWYTPEMLAAFRLSSKNHCDVPIDVNGRQVHLLLSHPTPPVFDGPEDRNGRRNHDELRFWIDYISDAVQSETSGSLPSAGTGPTELGQPEVTRAQGGSLRAATREGGEAGTSAAYIVDDTGEPGGLSPGSPFILLGDLNGDAFDGAGKEGIAALLAAPRILKYPMPTSQGAVEAARLQAGANASHAGPHDQDTEDAADQPGPGNLHLDYVLPSSDLQVAAAGVFWPESTDPLAALVAGDEHPASSDHRLVWTDLTW